MSETVVLIVATVLVGLGAVIVFVRDVRAGFAARGDWTAATPDRTRGLGVPGPTRIVVEGLLPLLGAAALLWWAWAVL